MDFNIFNKMGCIMGTICVPHCADVFMGKFEKSYISIYGHLRTLNDGLSTIYTYAGIEVRGNF